MKDFIRTIREEPLMGFLALLIIISVLLRLILLANAVVASYCNYAITSGSDGSLLYIYCVREHKHNQIPGE